MKKRTTISIAAPIRTMADQCMEARAFSDFSSYIEQLIREDNERRHGPHVLREAPPEYKVQGHKKTARQ